MLMKVTIPTDTGNAAIQNGTLGPTIEKMLADLKPEATYFAVEGGERTAYVFYDLKEVSGMVSAGEPLFLGLGAQIDVTPAMTPEELRKGLASLG